MAFKSSPLTKNRLVVFDLLNRARRDHCSVTGAFEWDVTETLARIERERAAGRRVGFTAYLVKATSLLLERHPRLGHRLFHGLLGPREVAFDHVSCNLVVARSGPKGEEILFPIVIRDSNRMSVEAIHARIRDFKTRPLDALDEVKTLRRVKRLPRLALTAFDYKVRTDPAFYERRFGTYGLSSILHQGSGAVGGSALSTSTAFFPTNLQDKAVVIDGKIVVRKMVLFGMIVDHYLIDGLEGLRAALELKRLVEEPNLVLG